MRWREQKKRHRLIGLYPNADEASDHHRQRVPILLALSNVLCPVQSLRDVSDEIGRVLDSD
jgi:hypothetical protein